MNPFKISKVIPNIIDIFLFLFIALSIYFKDSPLVSLVLIAIPSSAMIVLIIRQLVDCWKQKSVYNFSMIVVAADMKTDPLNRVVKDVIIYGLHIYLLTLSGNPFYAFSVFICLTYDILIYNAAFNPFMKNYLVNKALKIIEDANTPKKDSE